MPDDLPEDPPQSVTVETNPASDDALPESLTTPDVNYVLPAGFEPTVVIPEETLPPPTADPGPGVLGAVWALRERLDRRFDELQALFDREIRAEATREKVVDRLHAELQEYKHDLLLKTLRPVFLDMIQLHDDIGKVIEATYEGAELGDGASRLLGLMAGFQQGIEDILYRQGVEPFQVEGETFDPRRQRAVATVATEDQTLNKTVAARLRKGFASGDRVIRAEVVSVYAVRRQNG
jgi:molecular chaperone GrpE